MVRIVEEEHAHFKIAPIFTAGDGGPASESARSPMQEGLDKFELKYDLFLKAQVKYSINYFQQRKNNQ